MIRVAGTKSRTFVICPATALDAATAVQLLRPLAAESLLAIFQLTMSDAVENAFGREVVREM